MNPPYLALASEQQRSAPNILPERSLEPEFESVRSLVIKQTCWYRQKIVYDTGAAHCTAPRNSRVDFPSSSTSLIERQKSEQTDHAKPCDVVVLVARGISRLVDTARSRVVRLGHQPPQGL